MIIMKQFYIFLLLFRYCLAHIACTKERPFPTKYNQCLSYKDICIQYRSDDCQSALRACDQCPLSNFTSESIYQILRIINGGQDKNCSQTKTGTIPIQESLSIGLISQKSLANQLLWSILIIGSFLLIVSTLILLYLIYQHIRTRKRRTRKSNGINLLAPEMQIESIMAKLEEISKNQNDASISNLETIAKNQEDPIMKKLEDIAKNQKDHIVTKLEEIAENQEDSIVTKLDDIAKELSRFPNKGRKSKEKPTEICISWKDAENGFVPSGAIKVSDFCIVVRAKYKGEYIPGQLIEGKNFAYISYDDKVIPMPCYQVLTDTSTLYKPFIEWNYVCDKTIPSGAIIGGTDNGKALYIAKDVINGKDVVGKYQPEYGCAYFSVGDEEIKIKDSTLVLCYSKITKIKRQKIK